MEEKLSDLEFPEAFFIKPKRKRWTKGKIIALVIFSPIALLLILVTIYWIDYTVNCINPLRRAAEAEYPVLEHTDMGGSYYEKPFDNGEISGKIVLKVGKNFRYSTYMELVPGERYESDDTEFIMYVQYSPFPFLWNNIETPYTVFLFFQGASSAYGMGFSVDENGEIIYSENKDHSIDEIVFYNNNVKQYAIPLLNAVKEEYDRTIETYK